MTQATSNQCKPKVLIAVPTSGKISYDLFPLMHQMALDGRYNMDMVIPKDRPYEHNLQGIVLHALQSDADFLLVMDEDNTPTRNPLDLVELDKDVISCPTPLWIGNRVRDGQPIAWSTWILEDETAKIYAPHEPREGLQKIDASTSGSLLIARRVLLEITAPFMREWYEGRVVTGTDLAFSRRVAEAGFQMWTHYDYPCHHWNTVDLLEVSQALVRAGVVDLDFKELDQEETDGDD